MILVDARCTIRPEQIDAFLREVTSVIPLVRREPGCHRYELLSDSTSPEIFHFIEVWESREHLDAHIRTPHMQDYFSRTKECNAAPVQLTVYSISSHQTTVLDA